VGVDAPDCKTKIKFLIDPYGFFGKIKWPSVNTIKTQKDDKRDEKRNFPAGKTKMTRIRSTAMESHGNLLHRPAEKSNPALEQHPYVPPVFRRFLSPLSPPPSANSFLN